MEEVKVFRDPLYGYIRVSDPIIWKLIQTKEFQRLRRVHQLGGTLMVFHTAEHSRFSHSLGVYEIARRMVYEIDEIRTRLTKEERLILLCAGLLHDLGHGPYSHAFESVFQSNHEAYTIAILLGDTEVHHVLEEAEEGLSQKIANLIDKKCYKGSCEDLNCNHSIMISLISSQLDADRLDYLKRDAYNTGATYGEIDQDRILRSILVHDDKVVYKYSSLHTIEDYLMSRYHMYWQVYYHPVSISYEVVLVKIFQRAKDLLLEKADVHVDPIIERLLLGELSLEDHFELDEVLVDYQIKVWTKEKDPILKDLATRFITRRLFKYVICDSEEEMEIIHDTISAIFHRYGIDTNYYLQKDRIEKEAYQYYNEKVLHNNPILLLRRDKLFEIAEVSHIVKGIKDIGVKKEYKLFFPIEAIDGMKDEDREAIEYYVNR